MKVHGNTAVLLLGGKLSAGETEHAGVLAVHADH
jgi:hypothetical protein